jgi:hypothetical protein
MWIVAAALWLCMFEQGPINLTGPPVSHSANRLIYVYMYIVQLTLILAEMYTAMPVSETMNTFCAT